MKYLDTWSNKVYNSIEEWEAEERNKYLESEKEQFDIDMDKKKRSGKKTIGNGIVITMKID